MASSAGLPLFKWRPIAIAVLQDTENVLCSVVSRKAKVFPDFIIKAVAACSQPDPSRVHGHGAVLHTSCGPCMRPSKTRPPSILWTGLWRRGVRRCQESSCAPGSERKYGTFDRELLSLYLAVRHLRFLLEARPFTVFVDHTGH